MSLDLAARLHAFVFDLFRPSERSLAQEQYNRVGDLLVRLNFYTDVQKKKAYRELTREALAPFGCSDSHAQFGVVEELVESLLDREGYLNFPNIDWDEPYTVAELWDLRAGLKDGPVTV